MNFKYKWKKSTHSTNYFDLIRILPHHRIIRCCHRCRRCGYCIHLIQYIFLWVNESKKKHTNLLSRGYFSKIKGLFFKTLVRFPLFLIILINNTDKNKKTNTFMHTHSSTYLKKEAEIVYGSKNFANNQIKLNTYDTNRLYIYHRVNCKKKYEITATMNMLSKWK